MKGYKDGIWYILINGEIETKFYEETEAINCYKILIEDRREYDLDLATIELVRVLRTTNINQEPLNTFGDYKIAPSIEGIKAIE